MTAKQQQSYNQASLPGPSVWVCVWVTGPRVNVSPSEKNYGNLASAARPWDESIDSFTNAHLTDNNVHR